MRKEKRRKNITIVIVILIVIIVSLFYIIYNKNITGKASFLDKLSDLFQKKESLSPSKSSGENFKSLGYNVLKTIDKSFSESSEIDLDISKPIYGLSINAVSDMYSENSLIRVILVDKDNNEYLVYEAYPLLEDSSTNIENFCDETCSLSEISPSKLKIILNSASIDISKIEYADSLKALKPDVEKKGISDYNKELKKLQVSEKISKINSKIKQKNLRWVAGETSVSSLSYAQKKNLVGVLGKDELPNLQGFEYYSSGIFDLAGGKPTTTNSSPPVPPQNFTNVYSDPTSQNFIPLSWDWRIAHGENWMTPVRNQFSCASCWAFAAIGATEGDINTYYNQHINADISEQDSVCRHPGSCTNGGYPSNTLSELQSTGLVDEQCLPYTGSETSCTKCSDSQSRLWKITSYSSVSIDDASTKKTVFEKGPITFGIYSWWHVMTLAGYYPDSTNQTVWILKNSWGAGWGETGYAKMIVPQSDRYLFSSASVPYFAANPSLYQIKCYDKDNDNYCNWGTSQAKPSSCPSNCLDKKDLDDSNSSITILNATLAAGNALISVCREYLPNAVCPTTSSCPSGYNMLKTSYKCSGKGRNVAYWSYCVKDTNLCGKCSSNTELITYDYCAQSCSKGNCV